jgi:hypothetical protein
MLINTTVEVPVASMDAARQALLASLSPFGAKLVRDDGNGLVIARGSQMALRLKGGMIAPLKDFPVRATVVFEQRPAGVVAIVTVNDDLGYGSKLGMTSKYQNACTELATHLFNAMQGK